MLDEANRTAVFVYTMSELEFIEEHSSYTVTPTEMHFLNDNFSIYNYMETGAYTDVEFESCTYDSSFLENMK